MEAEGVEPSSCTGSSTASTCVAHRLMFPAAGWWAPDRRMSPLEFRVAAEDVRPRYPGFAIPGSPPREGW